MSTFIKVLLVMFICFVVVPVMIALATGVMAIAVPNFLQAQGIHHQFGLQELIPNYHGPGASSVFNLILWIIPLTILTALALVPILMLAMVIRLLSGGKKSRFDSDETRLMQEIHSGLIQMEKRVDALETILLGKVGQR